jgi:hypothetical protein
MKTKTTSILFFALLFTSAIYFNSCKRDESEACGQATTKTTNLTSYDLTKMPYTGTDTLFFLDQYGDTNIVVGGGKKYYTEPIYIGNGGPACPQSVNNCQTCRIDFNHIKGDLSFSVALHKNNEYVEITKSNYNSNYVKNFNEVGTSGTTVTMTLNHKQYTNVSIFANTYDSDTSYALYYNLPYGLLYLKNRYKDDEYTLLTK